jgi:ParB family transcriptional regulator, chromosome partitioning protein
MYTAIQQPIWRDLVTETNAAGSDEAYTPPWLIDATRQVLGDIDLDPASCARAQTVIQAAEWYDAVRNGLAQHWRGRMWLNPPFSDSLPWVKKAVQHWRAGDVSAALLLVRGDPSTEYSRLLAQQAPGVCFLERVQFWPQRINAKTGRPSSPDFPVLLWYLGADMARFRAVFERYGPIR